MALYLRLWKKKIIRARHLVSGEVKTCGCRINCNIAKPFLNKKETLHPRWKGGKVMNNDGYILQYIGNGKYEMEHRIVVKHKFKNLLNEVVHHINGIKTDNRIENLQILSRSEHAKHHKLGQDIHG